MDSSGPVRLARACTSAHAGEAIQAAQLADLGGERRRGPFRLLGRLDVVHAVSEETGGARRAGKLAQDDGMSLRADEPGGAAGVLDPAEGGVRRLGDSLPSGADRRGS